MLQRTSHVNSFLVEIVSFASIVQVGDSSIVNPLSRALAVQRETEIFYANEGNYNNYPVFSEPIPLPPINEDIRFIPHNLHPIINVDKIHIAGISSSSMLHIGSSQHISQETRIKHIRQLLPREEQT